MTAFPKDAFRDIVAELAEIQPACVRWGGEKENAAFPRGGKVQGSITINYVSRRAENTPIYEETFNPLADGGLGLIETRQREVRITTVQLLSETTGPEDSEDVLERVRFRLRIGKNLLRLRALGLVLVNMPDVQSLDGMTDQWESSTAVLEIRFRQGIDHTITAQPGETASEITETVEQIETVDPLTFDPSI